MACIFYNKDPMAIVHNMDSYFKQIPPDCSIRSEDGFEFPIHRELLYQTKVLRQMIKGIDMDCCKIEIMCPYLSREELETIVNFLYKGKIFCTDRTVAFQVIDNLKHLFGFPSRNFEFNGTILEFFENFTSATKVSFCKVHVKISLILQCWGFLFTGCPWTTWDWSESRRF